MKLHNLGCTNCFIPIQLEYANHWLEFPPLLYSLIIWFLDMIFFHIKLNITELIIHYDILIILGET